MRVAALVVMVVMVVLGIAGYAGAECRIVEYPDRNEVICEGAPGNKNPSQATNQEDSDKKKIERLESDLRRAENTTEKIKEAAIRMLEEQKTNILQPRSEPDPSQEVKVCCISAMEIERSSNYVTYSIKADIDNRGDRGDISVKLIGKNWNGHQIDFVYLTGVFDRKESRTATATTMLTLQQALDVRSWNVATIRKFRLK